MKKSDSSKKKPIFCTFGYVDYIILASSIAIALGDELSSNDLNVLSTFFAVLADELALISSVESSCSSSDEDEAFAAPVPAVSGNSRRSKPYCSKKNNRHDNVKVYKKKVIRKKIKKKKTLD